MKKTICLALLSLALQAQNLRECKNEADKIKGCIERWIYADTKGLWREATYQNGVLDGIEKWYHKNGKIDLQVPYKNGKIEGIERGYFDNGNLRSEAFYQGGKIEGTQRFYYKSGKLKGEIPHKNGQIQGVVKWYEENGTLQSEIEFQNNQALKGVCQKTTPLTQSQIDIINQNSLLSCIDRICF